MRREQRLTSSLQFNAVFKNGKVWATDVAVLRAMPNELDASRFGIIVSKRVGKKAVVRNRVKRLLREVLRLTPIQSGWDVIVIARPLAAEAGYREIEAGILGLLNRAGLLGEGR